MEKFKCRVQSFSGEVSNISISANNVSEVKDILRNDNLIPIKIKSENDFASIEILPSKIKMKQLIFFFSNTSMLLEAGLPIVECITIGADQNKDKKLKLILQEIAGDLSNGNSFYDSMKKHKEFPPIVSAVIKIGEATGKLKDNLKMIANYYDKKLKLMTQIKGSLAYPIIILCVSVLAMYIVSTKVLPNILNIVSSEKMNTATKILMGVGNFFTNYGIWPIVLTPVIIILARKLINMKFKVQKDRIALKTPIVGSFIKKNSMVQITSTMAILLGSGVSIVESIEILKEIVGNEMYKKSLDDAKEQVMEGKQLSKVLSPKLYDNVVLSVFSIGEKTGELRGALQNLATYLDQELDSALKRLVGLIMPIAIIIVAVFVVILVLGVLLPMYSMYDNLG